jgi:hypothetical protein
VAVYKTSNSGLLTRREYTSFLAGNEKFIPNYTAGAYDSIATVTVGVGGVSSVSFTSIPSTYQHLQIRAIPQTNRATYGIDQLNIQLNSDTGSTNYANHTTWGDGSAGNSAGAGDTNQLFNLNGSVGTSTGGTFGGLIIDVLDYTNTNKYKTARALSGVDINGTLAGFGGRVGIYSGLWKNTNAITSVSISPSVGTLLTQYSSFALYGIKGN